MWGLIALRSWILASRFPSLLQPRETIERTEPRPDLRREEWLRGFPVAARSLRTNHGSFEIVACRVSAILGFETWSGGRLADPAVVRRAVLTEGSRGWIARARSGLGMSVSPGV